MRSPSASARKKSRREQESFIQVQQLLAMSLLFLSVLCVLAAPVPIGKPSTYPAWWFARGVIAQSLPTNASPGWPTNYPLSDDYAAINQGQLKNFATAAYYELQATSPTNVWSTTYGTNLTWMVTNWNPTNGDAYATVNLGQLKTVAAPFYNVLIQIGYTNNYPWTGVGADDYSVANIGQAKHAFSFDVGLDSDTNGLPDWWETEYFGHTGNVASSSPDGNGYTLAQDYAGGANPTNYYSWPGTGTNGPTTVTPTVAIISGNNQVSTEGNYTDAPLVVKVTNSSGGAALTNAPVTFAVTAGGGQLLAGFGGTLANSASLTTDSSGDATVYFQQPATNGTTNTISASTASVTPVTFTETTSAGDGTLDAPSDGTMTRVSDTEIDLTWVNHATAATYIVVQDSSDNGATWTTFPHLSSSATSYAATGLTAGVVYLFRVAAGN